MRDAHFKCARYTHRFCLDNKKPVVMHVCAVRVEKKNHITNKYIIFNKINNDRAYIEFICVKKKIYEKGSRIWNLYTHIFIASHYWNNAGTPSLMRWRQSMRAQNLPLKETVRLRVPTNRLAHAVQKIAAYSFISKYATISRLFLFLRRVHLIYIRNIYCCTHAYFLLTLIVNKIL